MAESQHRSYSIPSNLSRRDLIAAFLGAPLAIAGCGRRETPPLPPGEIVGASADFGHRVRLKTSVDPPDDRWEDKRVVIVGGGVAGLSAARRFQQAGFEDFIVLELESVAGGTSRSAVARSAPSSVPHPWGAHYVPAPTHEFPELVELFEEMDLFEGRDARGDPVPREEYLCRDPQERIFYRGSWYEGLYLTLGATREDHRQFDAFQTEVDAWVGRRDGAGRRAFATPMSAGSDDAEVAALDQISMADWTAERGFTSSRLLWYIDYACRDDYGMRPADVSAWAGLFYFAARKMQPGGDSRPFITWPEGNGRIVSHLAGFAEDRLLTDWAVVEIVPRQADGRDVVDVIAVSRNGREARGFHADRVVFAAPHFVAPYVIRPWRDAPPAHIDDFTYGAWAVSNLYLRETPESAGFPQAWDSVLYESPSLGYVSASYQRGVDHGPQVWTHYFPMADDSPRASREKLLSTTRDEWAEVVLSDLEPAHPSIRQAVERIDVMRWGHAMIRPTRGFIWGGARQAAVEPYRGVHFAHSDLSGIALFEEAFDRGNKSADAVLEMLQ